MAAPPTEKKTFLRDLGRPVRAGGTALGHSLEPSVIANVALGAISVSRGKLFNPLEPAEAPMTEPLKDVLVTSWGHWRGEALAHVTAA